jgi:hypothetical protein
MRWARHASSLEENTKMHTKFWLKLLNTGDGFEDLTQIKVKKGKAIPLQAWTGP